MHRMNRVLRWQCDLSHSRSHRSMLQSNRLAEQQHLVEHAVFTAPGTTKGQDREHNQRDEHDLRHFMAMVVDMLVTRGAGEGIEPQSEHVEGRDSRSHQRDDEQ